MKPRTLWDCQLVRAMMALSVAPEGCLSSIITRAVLVSLRAVAGPGARVAPVGRLPVLSPPEAACAPTWGASPSMALQIRLIPVSRSENLAIFRTPGKLFQVLTSRPLGQLAASAANCSSVVNRAPPLCEPRCSVEAHTAMVLPASMVNTRVVFFTHSSIPLLPATVKRNLRSLALNSGNVRTENCSCAALRDDVIGRDGKEGAWGRSRASLFREDALANRKSSPASTNFDGITLVAFPVPAFLAHGEDLRWLITSMGREVGYAREEVKGVTLLPDRENHPVRLLVEGDHPVLLLG